MIDFIDNLHQTALNSGKKTVVNKRYSMNMQSAGIIGAKALSTHHTACTRGCQ